MHTSASEADDASYSQSVAAPPLRPNFQLSTEDGAVFLRVFSESLRVNRHYDLLQWLTGELQHFLPHSLLLSAWGDFTKGELSLDVVSALPGVRTDGLKHCRIEALVMHCYAQWLRAGREPLILPMAGPTAMPGADCRCAIHGALRAMRSLLVHGFRDARSGHESLYIYFNPASFTRGRCVQAFLSMVPLLVGPIDSAFRRVAMLPREAAKADGGDRLFNLTRREREIVHFLCEGRSNAHIAASLGISLFTVKNHLRSIFQKIGAESRAEVVATYHRARSRPARPGRR
jgi:transcriptional regulator EpsA